MSHNWVLGFKKRWGHLVSLRYVEGIDGGRRQLMYSQVHKTYEFMESVKRERGEDVRAGKRAWSPRQVYNLDDTCMRMTPKEAPMLAMKGVAKALRGHHKNYRESYTLLLTIAADGVPRVPPFIIVKGIEGEAGTLNQPAWWGTREVANMVKGTMMQESAIAQQPNTL